MSTEKVLTPVSETGTFKAFELARWEDSSAEYDRSFGPLTSRVGEKLVEILPRSASSRLLDIACGPGYVAGLAAARGFKASGIDFSPAMVALARTNFPEIEFDLGDAEHLSFSAGSFSHAVMNFGILHLAQPERALSEAFRVLSAGGYFAFSVWAPPDESLGFKAVLDAIAEFGAKGIELPAGPPFFKYSDASATEKELESIGFQSVSAEKVKLVWELSSGDELFQAFLLGTARTGGLLKAQPKGNLEAIRQAVVENIELQFRSGEKVKIPMAAVIYLAGK